MKLDAIGYREKERERETRDERKSARVRKGCKEQQ
jgi:hypothetical protein